MQVALSGGQIWKLLLAERFTQVVDSYPWVRCASGNVWVKPVRNAKRIFFGDISETKRTIRDPIVGRMA